MTNKQFAEAIKALEERFLDKLGGYSVISDGESYGYEYNDIYTCIE